MKPKDILADLVIYSSLYNKSYPVGWIIENLPTNKRKELKKLKSKDIADLRWPPK